MAGMLHTWGHPDTPICSDAPPVCLDASYIQIPLMPHMFKYPPYVPNAPLSICMFWGYLHVIGGCGGLSFCLEISPCVWMPPYVSNTPIYLYAPLHVCSRGYLHML